MFRNTDINRERDEIGYNIEGMIIKPDSTSNQNEDPKGYEFDR